MSMEHWHKPVMGLTGQIGAGKTLVASMLRDLGCGVINADDLAKDVTDAPEGVAFVRNNFGQQCVNGDGTINRPALADVIFSDPARKRELEDYVYPRLHERRKTLMRAYDASDRIKGIVIESPLLIETGLKPLCDRVILVIAGLEIRLARVGKSRSWAPEELVRREKFFLPVQLKRSIADDIVSNNSTIDDCRRQVENIFSRNIFSETFQIA